jgi:hypothetical protein
MDRRRDDPLRSGVVGRRDDPFVSRDEPLSVRRDDRLRSCRRLRDDPSLTLGRTCDDPFLAALAWPA